jgi:nitrogenase subunit NifH
MTPGRSSVVPALSLSCRRIGVFGKVGAGKSTVAVLLARALQGRGNSVLHTCLRPHPLATEEVPGARD